MSYIRDMAGHRKLIAPKSNVADRVGNALRIARRDAGLTQAELAQQARIGRQKLIQVEQGTPGVAIATYAAVADTLGLQLVLEPIEVPIADYPELRQLTWNRQGDPMISERDALALYERNWGLVDAEAMPAHEKAFLQRLVARHGHGVLHV